MRDDMAGDTAALLAELNDLLQLEYDALPSYTVALMALRDEGLREELEGFRADHERHVDELVELIRAYGGIPLRLPHLPTGLFKLGLQASALPTGDRGVLLAFRANELQSREKYARHAGRPHPADVDRVLRRAAEDEARHYAWAVDRLEALGAGDRTLVGMANGAFARFHGTTADAIEAAGRGAMQAAGKILSGQVFRAG